jgi:hypothetical protein
MAQTLKLLEAEELWIVQLVFFVSCFNGGSNIRVRGWAGTATAEGKSITSFATEAPVASLTVRVPAAAAVTQETTRPVSRFSVRGFAVTMVVSADEVVRVVVWVFANCFRVAIKRDP